MNFFPLTIKKLAVLVEILKNEAPF